jgi:cysteinyl-tRNA synthetase
LGLRVFNTMSQRKEPFRPLSPPRVTMFVCGPTVQGPIHLGHARTYIFYDVVARYLRHLGYSVEFLVNVTDVDERITVAARAARSDPVSFASRYSSMFLEDLDSLGIDSITRIEPVSQRVEDAIDQVLSLIDKGHAYQAGGWVYFDTSTFPTFGKLSHQSGSDLALRPLELSPLKRNLADFSLWRPETLVPGKWASPWGMGAPGWHIQDTAITTAVFGAQYDIHGGAYELIYPHHEAEIAQGESISGVSPMVKYWVHTHLVTMAGEKMSKSMGNVFTVRDALKQYSADELRFFLLCSHYREDMGLSGLKASAKRFGALKRDMKQLRGRAGSPHRPPTVRAPRGFTRAMDDDFDTPLAISVVEGAAEDAVSGGRGSASRQTLEELEGALGILGVRCDD